jgi:hypothetical protein
MSTSTSRIFPGWRGEYLPEGGGRALPRQVAQLHAPLTFGNPSLTRVSQPGQWGNVSENSGKRLPDSFSSAEFRMYSCATVITIQIDDTFRPLVMRFLPYSSLSTADVDLFGSFSWCCNLGAPLSRAITD